MNVISKGGRFDVHQSVTQSIIAAIEAGAGEFIMPWHSHGVAIAKPENARTRMEYHGINVLVLWAQACAHGFASGHWASYRQWQQLGAQVASGQRGTVIVFYKQLERGDDDGGSEVRRPSVARASRVFNADQVAGWVPPAERHPPGNAEVIESVAAIVKAKVAQHYSAKFGNAPHGGGVTVGSLGR